MAYVDPTRTRFRLTDLELAAAALVVEHGPTARLAAPAARTELDALDQAGAVVSGQLDPMLDAVLQTVVDAPLEIVIEVSGMGVAGHLAWVQPERAVVATDVGGSIHEYTLVEPLLLPWSLALAVGVGARPVEAARSPIELDRATLDAATEATEQAEPDRAAEVVRGSLPGEQATQLLALLDHRRATWRATAAWTDDGGSPTSTSVTVVDTGPYGYWFLDLPAGPVADDDPPDPDALVRFRPALPSEVWDALHELLPGATSPNGDPPDATSPDATSPDGTSEPT